VVRSSTPIFAVTDIAATLAYYTDVLGFERPWSYDDPPTFGGVAWADAAIMFCLQPELAAKITGHQHWFACDEVDELYALHQSRGAKIISELGNQPWGSREYVVEDLNGYSLRFAGSPTHTAKSDLFPEGVQVERRLPTEAEYAEVAGAAFGYGDREPGILESTWQGVVATNAEGKTLGILRIMRDAPGWFSIWDVAVRPEDQGKHIGEAMMKEALAAIREARQGACVYLFTFKHGFYERVGFRLGSVSMRHV